MKINHIKFGIISLLVSVIFGLIFFYYFSNFSNKGQEFKIVLGDGGFEPNSLTIGVGDTVVFSTQLNIPFWPASNLHPSHGIYPEFDPQSPINNSESWSFRFDKEGQWNFHDHLDPYFKGTIEVVKSRSGEVIKINCTDPSQELKVQCWEKSLASILESQGLEQAFKELGRLYETEPTFASICHDFVHKLGGAAYSKFKKHENFNLSPNTSYCGFGFYHGFMEALLHDEGDPFKAKEFCTYAKENMIGQVNAEGACYHGIGHGFVDGGNKSDWGDAQAMVDPALQTCLKIGGTDEYIDRCASGAFNSLAIMYNGGQYELKLDKKNPYQICSKQDRYFKKACYEEMNTVLMSISGGDLDKALDFIEKISEDEYAIYAVRATAAAASFHNKDNFMLIIDICNNTQDRIREGCLIGFAAGLVEHGKPGLEYAEGIKFCGLIPDKKLRDSCMETTLWYLNIIYMDEKMNEVCDFVSEAYKKLCDENNYSTQ